MNANLLPMTFVGELFDNIFAIRRVHDVIVALFRIPHRKAFMVSCRKRDVTCAAFLNSCNPLVCIKIVRIKGLSHFSIFVTVDVLICHIPFPLSEHTIKSPVEKNAEFSVSKILSGFHIFRGRNIRLRKSEATTKPNKCGKCFFHFIIREDSEGEVS